MRIPDTLEFTIFIEKLMQKMCLQIRLLQRSEDKDESRILLLSCGLGSDIPVRNYLTGCTKRLMTAPIINGLCRSNNSRFSMKVNISN
jgi:hypothetical protein